MIYLDYSATTPVLDSVLDSYIGVTKDYIGNANSIHTLGVKSKELMMKATKQISEYLNCSFREIIYTSGASESNSTAIIGTALKYSNRGKHIITSKLEHKSVLETMNYLSSIGYEISYCPLNSDGSLNINELENLIRSDTILVSFCYINSEIGMKTNLKTIREILNRKNKLTIFHSDMTQALGKTNIDLSDLDLASFSSHKIYSPKGIGILYKRENIEITPLIWGLTDNAPYRGGTPALPLIVSFAKGVRIALDNLDENIEKVSKLNKRLLEGLKDINVHINSNSECIPHILNLSLIKIKSETFVRALEKENIYISTTTACSSLEPSTLLKEITNDTSINTTSIRISISAYTTKEEIDKFIEVFYKTYNSLLLKE